MIQINDIPFHSKAKVLFENESFFAIEKPAGILSHPNLSENPEGSIILAPYDSKGEFYKLGNWKVFLLHRLDKETSGCLLLSLNIAAAKKIKQDFEQHGIQKEYTALLSGAVHKPAVWKDHLVKKAGSVSVDLRKKPNATTKVVPIHYFKKQAKTLVQFLPQTGRTHQLRVQASFHHAPILGDRQYGDFPKNKIAKQDWNLDRMFLHASKIRLKDPLSKKQIEIASPLPNELESVLSLLRDKP